MELRVVVVILETDDCKSKLLDLLGELRAKPCLATDQSRSRGNCKVITLDVLRVPEVCDQVANVSEKLSVNPSVIYYALECTAYTGAVGLFR